MEQVNREDVGVETRTVLHMPVCTKLVDGWSHVVRLVQRGVAYELGACLELFLAVTLLLPSLKELQGSVTLWQKPELEDLPRNRRTTSLPWS